MYIFCCLILLYSKHFWSIPQVALVFVNLMSCTLYVCLVVSVRRLHDYGRAHGAAAYDLMRRDVWLVRMLVQNGLAMFAVWGTVASMFNFAVVLTYRTGARQNVSSSVSLSILTLEVNICKILLQRIQMSKLSRSISKPPIFLYLFKWPHPRGKFVRFCYKGFKVVNCQVLLVNHQCFYIHLKLPLPHVWLILRVQPKKLTRKGGSKLKLYMLKSLFVKDLKKNSVGMRFERVMTLANTIMRMCPLSHGTMLAENRCFSDNKQHRQFTLAFWVNVGFWDRTVFSFDLFLIFFIRFNYFGKKIINIHINCCFFVLLFCYILNLT